jgi:hypothetical protein
MPDVDFNGDGRGDVLWIQDGDVAVSNWLGTASGGFAINDGAAYTQLNAMHQFVFETTGDFNGDGRTDVVWAVDPATGGGRAVWLTDPAGGFSVTGPQTWFSVDDPDWRIAGSGDFNGDGVDDLLWRHTNGTLSNWLGSPSGNFTINDANALIHVPSDWHIRGTGDFNGDGRDDLLWQSDGGIVSNWLGTASGGWTINDANAFTPHAPGTIIGIGDFNGDGLDDLLFRNAQNELYTSATGQDGYFDLHLMIGFVRRVPSEWQVVAVDDYDGDGIDDLLWRSSTGGFSNWLGVGDQYGFIINDDDAGADIPLNWQVVDQSLF